MFTHAEVWRGIDRLAEENGLTASGLARRAGLDPTTFNPSKRITKQGKPRWPSTESLAKILDAMHTATGDFVRLMGDEEAGAAGERRGPRGLRCVDVEQAAARPDLFDESGFPVGDGWDEIELPGLNDPQAYALELRGDALGAAYRDGTIAIVSPTAGVRRQDRVVVRLKSGEVLTGVLLRRTAQRIRLGPLDGDAGAAGAEAAPREFATAEVAWMARIMWVSQ